MTHANLALPRALGVLLLQTMACNTPAAPPAADVAPGTDTARDAPGDAPGDTPGDIVLVDLDPGIRCNDPGTDPDSGIPYCGRCVRPDGTPVGCARCPEGADAGGQSLC